jgi:hypothetical protein
VHALLDCCARPPWRSDALKKQADGSKWRQKGAWFAEATRSSKAAIERVSATGSGRANAASIGRGGGALLLGTAVIVD